MKKALFIFFLGMASVQGASSSEASVLDLKWPVVNFVILFGLLFWRIKRPLAEMFNKKAVDTEELYNLAQEKDKEAQIRLEMYQKKMETVDRQCENIVENSRSKAAQFVEEQKREGQRLIERMRQDGENRTAFEKRQMLQELNYQLVNEIVAKTELRIADDKGIRENISKRLISQAKVL